jgi:hypothetical protein
MRAASLIMTRFASALLLLGGAVILITLQVSPATSAPGPRRVDAPSPLDQVSPILLEVNTQVDRMRARLDATTDYPQPRRDPFSFGEVARPAAPTPPRLEAPAPVHEAPPVLPRLVAVLSAAADGGWTRTAVFAAGDDVQLVTPGDRIGIFVVRSIAADAVTLVDPTTGAAFRVQ